MLAEYGREFFRRKRMEENSRSGRQEVFLNRDGKFGLIEVAKSCIL